YLHSSHLASSWVCLRTNGSIRRDEGFVATGYICDHNGGWIIGFYQYLSNYTLTKAESIEAVNIIQGEFSENSNSTLIRRIFQVLNMFKQWKIQYLRREENSIADSLAKSVCTRSFGLRLFEYPHLLI
ncbi:hypothetical protein Golob_007360, partial [Gossypium lobatum]|nr:hypothetical protein [Gossypium lobatum]